ncbi:MAG: diguanylate cyclase [Pseudomonadota bacterium]
MQILILESSTTYQRLLSDLVKECGATPHVVGTIAEAWASKLERFGAVLTSYHLPDGTGVEFVREFRATKGRGYVPVIMFSAEGNDRRRDGVAAGVTEFYNKSDFNGFQTQLRQYLRRHVAKHQLEGHVLYVEDSRTDALIMEAHFQGLGVSFERYTDAESAFDTFADRPGAFDLVITDMILRGQKSGLDLVRSIREFERADEEVGQFAELSVPILAVTGFDETTRRVNLFDAGIDDYIGKPFVAEELLARVRNLVCRHQLARRVQALATTDQLTGCRNRHSLAEETGRLITRANREDLPLSIAVIDLDHFKRINDEYGHAMGDEVLSQVGQSLRDSVRGSDLVARFGGEEFVIVFPDCDGRSAADRAETLRGTIAGLRHEAPLVSASIGIAARVPGQCETFDELFRAADSAVYAAKSGGRNQVCVADDGDLGSDDEVIAAA